MPHVDDGVLHAYLDGALAALSDAGELPEGMTAADVVSHLGTCADCRARLDTERDTRERAGLVLGDAALSHVDVPPYASIAGPPRARRRRWVPVSWAASVLVALGAGWWGSAIWRTQALSETSTADEASSTMSAPPLTPSPAGVAQAADTPRGAAHETGAASPAHETRATSPADEKSAGSPARESGSGSSLAALDTGAAQETARIAAQGVSRFAPGDSARAGEAAPAIAAAAENAAWVAAAGHRRAAEAPPIPIGRSLSGRTAASVEAPLLSTRVVPVQPAPTEDARVSIATDTAAFDRMLAREESGVMQFIAAAEAIPQGVRDQLFIIADASEPVVEVAHEIGQTTVRVRQVLATGEDIEVLTWQQHSSALDQLIVTGVGPELDRSDSAAARRRLRSNLAPRAPRPPDSTGVAAAPAAPLAASASDVRHAGAGRAMDARAQPEFVVDRSSPRTLSDGRRELVLRSASGAVWITIRADLPAAELATLVSRLTQPVPPR